MNKVTKKPNFLIFIIDQIHPDYLGYAGHPVVKTPNIDKLAESGMNFSRMYTSQPLCMPARLTMFTGLTPRGHKVRMNGIPLDPSIPTFVEALRQNGYHTHCSGKIHLSPGADIKGVDMNSCPVERFPENRKFWLEGKLDNVPLPYYGLESVDYYGGCAHGSYGHYLYWLNEEHTEQAHYFYNKETLESPSQAVDLYNRNSYKWALPYELHPSTWIANKTIDFLEESVKDERPFCLMCSIQEPHPPFAPPAPYCYRYNEKDVIMPKRRIGELNDMPPHYKKIYEESIFTSGNSGEAMKATEPYYEECASHYYGLIEMVDDQIGRVLEALKKHSLDEETIVMFVADHGEAMGDHGMYSKGPYHYDSVIRIPFLVRWPGHIQAHTKCDEVVSLLDFAPTILDMAGVEIPEGETPAIKEAEKEPFPWPGRSLLPVLLGEETLTELPAIVEMDEDYLGFKMRTLVTKRYRMTCYSGHDYGELFDLESDPNEYYNLWDVPEYESIRDGLRIKLLNRIMETDISVPRQLCRA